MVPLGSEPLFPARILRFRKRAANVAGNDSAVFAQFPERPFEIGNVEPATFPICRRLFRAKTIEIDRDIDVLAAEISSEYFEIISPIFT